MRKRKQILFCAGCQEMVRIPLNTDNTDPVHLTIPMRVVSPCPPIATKGPPLSPWQPSFPGVEIKILKKKFKKKN